MTVVQTSPAMLPILRTIQTGWTPYALMFSPDGSRLAIGGGTWYGQGGIMLVDHVSGRSTRFADLPELAGGTVSGLCFSADAKHLVASVWPYKHEGGRVVVFEVDGLELRAGHAIHIEYARDSPFSRMASSVTLYQGTALVRNYRNAGPELIMAIPLPLEVHRGAVPSFGSQRLVVVGDRVVTGNHGESRLFDSSRRPRSSSDDVHGRLVVASIADLRVPAFFDTSDGSSICAVTRVRDRILTGGRDGELDAWSIDDRWQRERLRPATQYELPPNNDLEILSSTYSLNSIVDLCAIPHAGAASVSLGRELCLFDVGTGVVSYAVPGPGSPRSLAAHPDGSALAVGVKHGGAGKPEAFVVVFDLRASIEPAWRTPTVRSLADAASRGDTDAFVVLADVLEAAGVAPSILHHLRHHDHALTRCWVIDALVVD